MIELKKLLDENKKQLSDLLQDCQSGSPELSLLEAKMGPLLEEFSTFEEALFSLNEPASQDDES